VFTKANADELGRSINKLIDEYVEKNSNRVFAYTSLGDLLYISLLKQVDLVIGNSSSGLIEAPFFHKPTVNIGNRQAMRLRAATIIDCCGTKSSIISSIQKALSDDFQVTLKNTKLEYRQDRSAEKIKQVIKKVDLSALILKQFYDLSVL
jgi:UDP-N-acetylglucosamine 2-epimerase